MPVGILKRWKSLNLFVMNRYRRFYAKFQQRYEEIVTEPQFVQTLLEEQSRYGKLLRDRNECPPLLATIARKESLEQMANPLRIVTTSSMITAKEPYFGGGKWRMAERDAWWDKYQEDTPVIIGHFWRQFSRFNNRISGVFGKDLFAEVKPHAWMGTKHNVYCVDYSVGQRHLERKQSADDEFYGKLAALRLPERQVMHDDGTLVNTY